MEQKAYLKNPDLQSPLWRACYAACLREFNEHEFGTEAKLLAEKAADKIMAGEHLKTDEPLTKKQ